MPIIRLKEIFDMDSKERRDRLSELRAELSRLRTMISAGGAVENPARIRELRRTIAKILTVENQQEQKPMKSGKQATKVKGMKTKKLTEKSAKTKEKEKKKE